MHVRHAVVAAGLFLASLISWAAGAPAGSLRSWRDYRVIMWVGDTVWKKPEQLPLFLSRLREMGVDTGMVYGGGDPGPLLTNRFPYYVENLVNRGLCLKWNSTVTDWDRFVTDWVNRGRPEAAFVRDYCLDDPGWRAWARGEVRDAARKHRPHTPLAYNLRDELSTTVSANPFDYDFSPAALAGFRDWLRTRYRDLAAVNAEWETQFDSWESVRPFSTDRIKNRMASGTALPHGTPDWPALQRLRFAAETARREPTRWNFAPWCDFRTYMDFALARALDDLRDAIRDLDPATPVGIEGTQMPSAWGGYDLWRLAQAVDWIEPYDIGNAREILGSFMPGKALLTTVFETTTSAARRRLWHLLLEGDRGCLIWWSEDCIDWRSPDYALTPKAKALVPVLRELKSPLAALFLRAERVRDPIYLHYSQPSIQVDWLLESTVDGSTWLRRFSSFEADHNQLAKVRDGWLKVLQDLGFSPQFISSEQLERWKPGPADPCVLVLPSSLAMSDRETVAVQSILNRSRTAEPPERLVLSDGPPGLFDEHGRLRATNALERLFPVSSAPGVHLARGTGRASREVRLDTVRLAGERLSTRPDERIWEVLAEEVGRGPIQLPPPARARVHRFSAGTATLVAIERNVDYHMSEELKQAGGNEALEKVIEVTARLSSPARPVYVYDLRSGKLISQGTEWSFTLDPWQPSLFALLREPAPAGDLVGELLARTE